MRLNKKIIDERVIRESGILMNIEQEKSNIENDLDCENKRNAAIKCFMIMNIIITSILIIVGVIGSPSILDLDIFPYIYFYIIFGIIGTLVGKFYTKIKLKFIHIIVVFLFVLGIFAAEYFYASAKAQVTAKPIIYLYPEEETNVNVLLGNLDLLTCTYPSYDENRGWNVVAKPNGDLKYEDRNLYALYWEGNSKYKKEIKVDGFVVKGEDTAKFLEEKLSILGLTDREAEEFIVYWLPRMEKNKYNYIRFEPVEEIEHNVPLEINPKPDTTIRVMMDWCEIKNENEAKELKKNIKQQDLHQTERKGYVAVEWGGSEI